MSKFLHKLSSFLSQSDIFGTHVSLYIDEGNTIMKSRVGGSITLFIIGLSLYIFIQSLIDWSNFQSITTTSSTFSPPLRALITKGVNYTYNFSNENYYPYFTIAYPALALNFQALNKYVTQKLIYYDNNLFTHPLEYELCPVGKMESYLGGFSQEQIIKDNEQFSKWMICIKNSSFEMGLYPDQNLVKVNSTGFYYSIDKCKNSTENNNSCAPDDEIRDMLPNIRVQMSVPTTYYDFNDEKNLKTRSYVNQFYFLDYQIKKYYLAYIVPTTIISDNGLFSDQSEPISLDFVQGSMEYDNNFRKNEKDQNLFKYEFQISYTTQTYHRKNMKINAIVTTVGGTLNILVSFGSLICLFYNKYVLSHHLINFAFENAENNSRKKGKKDDFPFSSLFIPIGKNYHSAKVALYHLHEYLNIKNIIRKLQDLEKIKLIIFDPKQRKMFDQLPKPKISSSCRDHQMTFSSNIKTLENDPFNLNSPISKRLLIYLDDNKLNTDVREASSTTNRNMDSSIKKIEVEIKEMDHEIGELKQDFINIVK